MIGSTFASYTEDIYDIVDVSKMAVGDTFEAEGKTVTIESMETDEFGHININGGYDAENGYTLTTEDDSNGWTTLLDDDFCTYTERGAANLELAENVTFTDSSDIEAFNNGSDPLAVTGIEAVTKAIMESANDSFYEHNTTIVIEGGKVTEINRVFGYFHGTIMVYTVAAINYSGGNEHEESTRNHPFGRRGLRHDRLQLQQLQHQLRLREQQRHG